MSSLKRFGFVLHENAVLELKFLSKCGYLIFLCSQNKQRKTKASWKKHFSKYLENVSNFGNQKIMSQFTVYNGL